jgi:hypothetical protein
MFLEVVDLERGPLSLVSSIEELVGRKRRGSGQESRDYGCNGYVALVTRHPLQYLQSSSYLTGSTLRLHKVKLSPYQAVEAYRVVRC